jgi:hypothetical protein
MGEKPFEFDARRPKFQVALHLPCPESLPDSECHTASAEELMVLFS